MPLKIPTRMMVRTALAAAALCVVGPLTLNFGPIPLSLCTLLLYLIPYALSCRWAATATLLYLLVGLAGLPVFSGFRGGIGAVLGPTGGFLAGYLPLVLLSGWIIARHPQNRWMQLFGMALGTAVLYALGTCWYCLLTGNRLLPALAVCVLPFLPGDALKIGAALHFGAVLRKWTKR